VNRKRTFLLSGVVAALAIVSAPATAQAADSGAVQSRGDVHAKADGRLHAWQEPDQQGTECSWSGDNSDWGNFVPWDCGDRTSSIANYGYPGAEDDVWVYQDAGYEGLRRGIKNGDYIANLAGFTYDNSHTSMDNSISSHNWTDF
jgi:hypothetical protein